MTGTLALEVALILRSGLTRIALCIFGALIAMALWTGTAQKEAWSTAFSETRAATERKLAHEQENVRLQRQEGFYPPGSAGSQAMDVTLPPSPGVLLSIGDSVYRPISASISTSSRSDSLFKSSETASAITASLGDLDLTWIAVVLLPLLVIALTHDLLAADRDSGRLALLRAQGHNLPRLIWRRLALRMALPASLLALAAIAAVALNTPIFLTLAWWLVANLYVACWGLACARVSIRASSSQSAAAVLLLSWLALVVILPSALTLASGTLAPVPSRLKQVTEGREIEIGLQSRTAELLDRYLVDHPQLAGAGSGSFSRDYFLAQREIERELAPLAASYDEARSQQRWLGQQLSWLSPSMAAHTALMHIAGTDGARHDAFVSQANEFASFWRDRLQKNLFADRALTADEIAALPRFTFKEPTASPRIWGVALYLAALLWAFGWMISRALRGVELR